MAAPVVATSKINPVNGEQRGLLWVFEVNEPVVFKYAVESTGDDNIFINQKIDWGDGNIIQSSKVPIGRYFQSQHAYTEVGEYVVKLGAVNLSREECVYNNFNTVRIRVIQIPKSKQQPVRWKGLALPFKSVADNLSAIEDVFLRTQSLLAVDADAGETQIVIAGDALEFVIGAQVIVTQEDKLITSATITGVTLNVISLDLPLVDSYSKDSARVELIRQNLGRTFRKEVVNQSWYFPISTDVQLVKAEISAILSVRMGERVMLRDFGSRIHELVFEQNDRELQHIAKEFVIDAITRWSSRAEVLSSSIVSDGDELRISLQVKHNLDTFSIDFTLNELLLLTV